MIRVFTAFSGYDSQCMALDNLKKDYPQFDYNLVGWSEIDKFAIKAHNVIYPQYSDRNFGDISKINWSNVPDFDLFTYSSPYQDFSSAGLRRGGEKDSGTRSSLLWEVEKAIVAKRPKYLLMENVSALATSKFIKLFNKWQLTLQQYGYISFTKVLNAKDYGVPQNRERIFMVSILNPQTPYYFFNKIKLTKKLVDILEDEPIDKKYYLTVDFYNTLLKHNERHKGGFKMFIVNNSSDYVGCICAGYGTNRATDTYVDEVVQVGNIVQSKGFDNPQRGRIYSTSGIAPTLNCCRGGGLEPKIVEKSCIRKLTPKECFRLMGVSETNIKKFLNCGLSNSQLYKLAGNSIVVDCLYYIFRQLFICNFNTNQQNELF